MNERHNRTPVGYATTSCEMPPPADLPTMAELVAAADRNLSEALSGLGLIENDLYPASPTAGGLAEKSGDLTLYDRLQRVNVSASVLAGAVSRIRSRLGKAE